MLQNRQEQNCSSGGGTDSHFHLRIGSIFVILIGATSGALFPVLAKRSKRINLPPYFFEYVHPLACLALQLIAFRFAKYFGSGVIVRRILLALNAP